jgi:pyruvate dehydrogenase E2 component (dihydrolipoamide acetyltransferase)
MPIEIKVPRLGWSMEEGIFSGWLKKDGEAVASGETLFTLEGEKSAQDIESTDSGKLQIPKESPKTGETVKVGQVIGYLIAENEKTAIEPDPGNTPPSKNNQPDGSSKIQAPPILDGTPQAKESFSEIIGGPASSPRARRRAAELGVDLKNVSPTGTAKRLVEADVWKIAGQSPTPVSLAKMDAASGVATAVSSMRRNIAERTAFSFSHIPHFYVRAEADASELVALREHLVGVLEKECGIRITLTDFLLKAQAIALREFPAANAIWQDDKLLCYRDSDVGLVVSLPDGLVIPVIRAAQKLSLVQLARERARLVTEVKEGRFNAAMTAGGAASLSNLGTTRTDDFSAVIAPHQSSMLAVGRAAPRPYVVNDNLETRTTIRLCLSADHRVLDGGPAADFLGKIVELIETPKALVEAI